MTDVEREIADFLARAYPLPSVSADWDDILERAGTARRQRRSRTRSRWVVAVAILIVLGGVLVTPPLGLGQRMVELVRREPFGIKPHARGRVTRSVDGIRFSLAAKSGGWMAGPHLRTDWQNHIFSITTNTVGPQGAEAIIFWTTYPARGDATACDNLKPAAGRSTADLATTMAKAPGTKVTSGPRRVTLGGRAAWQVALTVTNDAGCDPGFFFRWRTDLGGAFWNKTQAHDTLRVWLVDVSGKHLVFAAVSRDPGLTREILEIVQSIRFE